MHLVLAAGALIALGACARGDDRAATDTSAAATATSGGDVRADSAANASASLRTPAQQVGFLQTVDQAEVEEGEVARTKATNAQVRQYAQRMVTEHSTHMRRLGTIARAANVDSSQAQPPTDLQQMHQQTMDRLNSTPRGVAFDTAYINAQVMTHQTVLQRLQAQLGTSGSAGAAGSADTAGAAGGAGNAQLHTLLQETARAVETHLQQAQQIQQRLAGTGTARP